MFTLCQKEKKEREKQAQPNKRKNKKEFIKHIFNSAIMKVLCAF